VNATEITGFVLTLLVMLVGLIGSVLPGLPGTPVIFAAAIAHRLYFGDRGAAWWALLALGFMTSFSLLLDFLATTLGAKKLGATWLGMGGAVLGATLGIFVFPPWGLLLGPLVGAALAEMLGGREWREASKAGLGAAAGVLAGTLGKLACSLAMIGLFVLHILLRSLSQGN
jgi:uncharacterized protein YqgC (DUF456 family)